MTKEEIGSARVLCALGQATFSPRVYRDYSERALGLLPQALNALEEANREIKRLRHETRDCICCQKCIEPNMGVCFGCMNEAAQEENKTLAESTT